MARELLMSPRTLTRRLQELQTTYNLIVAAERLRCARELLAKPHFSVSQVAQQLGYADPAIFTRAFKRWTGQNPSEFRQQIVNF